MFLKKCPGCVCDYPLNLYAHVPAVLEELQWKGEVFGISALTGDGTGNLVAALMARLEQIWGEERDNAGATPEDAKPWDPLE